MVIGKVFFWENSFEPNSLQSFSLLLFPSFRVLCCFSLKSKWDAWKLSFVHFQKTPFFAFFVSISFFWLLKAFQFTIFCNWQNNVTKRIGWIHNFASIYKVALNFFKKSYKHLSILLVVEKFSSSLQQFFRTSVWRRLPETQTLWKNWVNRAKT